MLHKLNASCSKFSGTGKTSHMETIKVSILILHYGGPAVEIMFCTQISSGILLFWVYKKGQSCLLSFGMKLLDVWKIKSLNAEIQKIACLFLEDREGKKWKKRVG